MGQALSFIYEIVVPVVVAIMVISRMTYARHHDEKLYALIGILAIKGILDMADLGQLKIFEPQEDMLKELVSLLRTAK